MKHIVIPIFVPHKGCPFDCIYCNQKKISGQIEEMTKEKMISIIESHLLTVPKNAYIEIGFYGGSFTGINKDEQIELLETANRYIKDDKIKGIRLSTRPDYINKEILDYLKFYNVKTIELGVQSLDEEVLKISCRGHNTKDVTVAANLIKEYGISLGIQTMIGLPGDDFNKDLITAKNVIEMKPEILRIYPTLVIRGTYLEKLYHEGKYKALSLDEAVENCSKLLRLYESNGINVIRIGLQPTDSINENMDVVAGPFHPSFRQLVESKLLLERIENAILENKILSKKRICIFVNEKDISNAIGQKKQNVIYLKKKYGFLEIKIIGKKTEDIDIKEL